MATHAVREFNRAIALDPGYITAYQLNGWRLITVGRFDEAQAEMKSTLEPDPLMPGLVYEQQGKFSYAIAEFEPGTPVE